MVPASTKWQRERWNDPPLRSSLEARNGGAPKWCVSTGPPAFWGFRTLNLDMPAAVWGRFAAGGPLGFRRVAAGPYYLFTRYTPLVYY